MGQGNAGDTLRQLQVGNMQGVAQAELSYIYRNIFRQETWQTADFKFRHQMVYQSASFNTNACGVIDEMKRNFYMQWLVRINALKVSMHDAGLGRVALQRFDNDIFINAIDIHGNNG